MARRLIRRGAIILLKGAGYEGWAILELDPPPNPVTDIASGLKLVSQGYDPILH